jgi:hypothetical protein
MPIDIESQILITNLLNTYGAPCSASQKAALFAEDSTLIVQGGAEYKGAKMIEQFFQAADKSKKPGHPYRHHLSSIKINTDGSDEATATSYFLVMGNSFPDHWGIYHDTLIRINGEWLFKVRKVTIEGADPRGWIGSGKGPVKFEPVD